MLREIKWDDMLDDQFDLTGSATGWGLNFSSNLKFGKKRRTSSACSCVYGEGIENYMNDSPVDIGIVNNFGNPVTPILGKPIPLVGTVIFLDHTWNDQVDEQRSATRVRTSTTPRARRPTPSRRGQYALGNLLFSPVPNVMMGGELQWGRRDELLRRLPVRRVQGPVLVQVQLLLQARRLMMERSTRRTVMSWRTLALAAIALTLAAPSLRAQSAADIQKAVDAAYAKYKGSAGRQERRLHSRARQGRPESVRDRGRHAGRQGLHAPAT